MHQPFKVIGTIEIEKEGKVFMTYKRVVLLKLIIEKGSINAAAKELRMSYQQAWFELKVVNELSPMPVIVRQRGGANGGGAQITAFGLKVLNEYEKLIHQHEINKSKLTEELKSCFFNHSLFTEKNNESLNKSHHQQN